MAIWYECNQPNMVNVKEMIEIDEINEMDCELKEIKWNMFNEVSTEGNDKKHKQWSVDWRRGDETWTMKSII